MPTIKDTTVTIGGLSTLSNELSGKPDGSLADCDNIVLRKPGVLEPAPYLFRGVVPYTITPSTVTYSSPVYATADTVTPFISVWQMGQDSGFTGKYWLSVFDLDANVAYNYGNVVTSTALSLTRNLLLTPGDAQASWSRNRRLYTTDRGCLVWTRNTANTDYELRLAGMPQPRGIGQYTVTAVGTPPMFPNPYAVAYRATLLRKYPDYTIESAPCPRFVNRGAANVKGVQFPVTFDKSADVRVGDIVVVYRTVGIDDPDGDADPGDDMQEATRQTLVAADITNGYITVTDSNRDTSLGAALYTSVEGLINGNAPPPNAHDVCTFNDTTFYAMTKDYPVVSFSIPNLGPRVSGAAVGTTNLNITTAVLNATTGTIPGDQTDFVQVGMVIFHPASAAKLTVATVSYAPGPNLTTVTFTSGGFSGYTGALPAAAGVHAIYVSDSIIVTYNEYGGGTTQSIVPMYAPPGLPDYVYAIPSGITWPTLDQLVRTEFAMYDLSPNADGVTFSARITLRMTQAAAYESLSVLVTHGSGYMGMDSYTNVTVVGPPKTVTNTATKVSTQSVDKATLYFSKSQLPEAVPVGNYIPVGHGEIQRLFSDQNSLYAACTDGLYRITGQGNDWTVVQLSKTFRLVSKNAVTQCLGTPFVWAQDGIVAVNESGPKNVSDLAIGPALSAAADFFTPGVSSNPGDWLPVMTGDDVRREITLQLDVPRVDPAAANIYQSYVPRGGNYVLNLNSLAFYRRTQLISGARCYQPKWRTSYMFSAQNSAGTNGPALIFWERHAGEESFDPAKYPAYQRIVTRVYPTRVYWWFNSFKAQASVLKQWIDCNLMIRQTNGSEVLFEVGPTGSGEWFAVDEGANAYLRFLFADDQPDLSLPLTKSNWRYATEVSAPREHCLVPRRAAVGDTLRVGVVLLPAYYTLPLQIDIASTTSYMTFMLDGFTLRYRVASDTFQV